MFCIPWTCVICLKEPSITSRFHATGSSMFTIYLFKSMHAWSAWLHVGLGSLAASGLSFVSESPTFITTTFATFPCHLCVHHSPENVFITHIKEVGSCLCCRIEEFGDIHIVGVLECTGNLQIIQGQVDKPFCKFSYGINRTWGIKSRVVVMREEMCKEGWTGWLHDLDDCDKWVSGRKPALCQQFQMVIVLTSFQASSARCIALSWLML